MQPIRFLSLAILCIASGAQAQEKVRIVTLGDSITRGMRTGVKAEETFAALLEKDLNGKGLSVEVVNVGIGGERTDQARARLAKVIALKPRIVTIMYGTNDSYVDSGAKDSRLTADTYRTNLVALVTDLRKAGIEPVLMTPPVWGDKAKNGLGENPNVRLVPFVKACRAVAEEEKVKLVDHFRHWTAASEKGTDIATWTTDLCHPNPPGHRELANLIRPVVEELLKK